MLLGCDASIRYELTNFNKGWLFNILICVFNKIRWKWIKTIKPNDKTLLNSNLELYNILLYLIIVLLKKKWTKC